MHQQPYCLTLPKPFFKIFLFRIYAPTIHSTDIEFDETSVRSPHISAPTQPRKPIHQRHCPHPHTRHEFHATTDSAPIQPPQTPHSHPHTPQPYSLHRHTTQATAPDAVDVDAPTLSQPRCTCSHAPVRNWTGQAQDQATQKQTVSGHARNWTGHIRPDRPRPN